MKTMMIVSAAALLVAGTASAEEIRVVTDPGANITVRQFQYQAGDMPVLSDVDGDGDFEGVSTSDEVGLPPESYGIDVQSQLPPGFEPDALIYVWTDRTPAVQSVTPRVGN